MITHLSAKNFKSWEALPEFELAPITGLFGSNSSGKTSILQLLLMLKQTSESVDRFQPLEFGSDRSLTELGSFTDVLYQHDLERELSFSVTWRPLKPLIVADPSTINETLFTADEIRLSTTIVASRNRKTPVVEELEYSAGPMSVRMHRSATASSRRDFEYELSATLNGRDYLRRTTGRSWPLPSPVKYYGFPDEAVAYFQNSGFVGDLELAVDRQLGANTYYLGPLRDYPARQYRWQGSRPVDVGARGERAVEALLASRDLGRVNTRRYDSRGHAVRRITVEAHVAAWLAELGLVEEFSVEQLAPDADIYRVFIRRTGSSSRVLLTDVGFGVSQVLPVLTLLAYAPEGSTVVLEQPEIHLHPAVQAALADVIIEAAMVRRVQVILESHSEHLLKRMQLRLAQGRISHEEVSLHFCELVGGASRLRTLDVTPFGEIKNWPRDFFGNPVQEAMDLARATIEAKKASD